MRAGGVVTPSLSLSLQLMSKLNKFLSLEMWIPIQRASSLHCGVDSSLIRKFLHECSCTSRLLSRSVIINAALRVQGELGKPTDRTLSLFAVQQMDSQQQRHLRATCTSDKNGNLCSCMILTQYTCCEISATSVRLCMLLSADVGAHPRLGLEDQCFCIWRALNNHLLS